DLAQADVGRCEAEEVGGRDRRRARGHGRHRRPGGTTDAMEVASPVATELKVRLPKRPSASSLKSESKKSVLVGPAGLPLLKAIRPQRPLVSAPWKPPSSASGWPLASESWPRKAPLAGSKTLTWLSPKLPTRMSLLKVPKSGGAGVTPQGEFSSGWTPGPPSRRINAPGGEKTSTTPLPGPATSSCRSASCLA